MCRWISLTQSSIKILGAHFTYNEQLDEKMNFYQLIIDSRTLLNIWKQRWLSLAGKIQTFKSLIASEPVYIATMKNTPPFVPEKLQALQKDFIGYIFIIYYLRGGGEGGGGAGVQKSNTSH